MSGGFRVSDSTIETAAATMYVGPFDELPAEDAQVARIVAREMLTAVLPSLVAEIREQIAEEIRREAEAETVHYEAFQRAVAVARGDAG